MQRPVLRSRVSSTATPSSRPGHQEATRKLKLCPTWGKLPRNSHFQPHLRDEKAKGFYVFARVQIPSAPPSSLALLRHSGESLKIRAWTRQFRSIADPENGPRTPDSQIPPKPIPRRFC